MLADRATALPQSLSLVSKDGGLPTLRLDSGGISG
jgi:hypothetical protein